MRAAFLILPLAAVAAPAFAAPPAARPPETMKLPPELTDPRTADRLTDAMEAMSKAFLDLPVGEVEAALQGRQPTTADKGRTVASETGMTDQQLRAEIDRARPQMQAGLKAVATALPAMMKSLSEAQRALEQATANLPRADYPRR